MREVQPTVTNELASLAQPALRLLCMPHKAKSASDYCSCSLAHSLTFGLVGDNSVSVVADVDDAVPDLRHQISRDVELHVNGRKEGETISFVRPLRTGAINFELKYTRRPVGRARGEERGREIAATCQQAEKCGGGGDCD